MLRSKLRQLFRGPPPAPSAVPPFTKNVPGYERFDIGDYTYGTPRVLDWGADTSLHVGKYCSISADVTIFLGGEHRTDWVSTYPFPEMTGLKTRVPGHPWTRGDVVIGHDVWIGLGAMIRSGTQIGNGAVIGAGAMVVSNVPPYAIVAGNPAKLVRKRFTDEQIDALQEIEWWNWPADRVRVSIPHLMNKDISEFIRYARQGQPVAQCLPGVA